MLLFTASTMMLAGAVFWMTDTWLTQQLETRVQSALQHFTEDFPSRGPQGLVEHVAEYGRGPGALEYLVQSPQGIRLAGDIPTVGARRGWLRLTTMEQGAPKRLMAYAEELPGGVVVAVGDDLNRIRMADTAILRAFAWAASATLMLGIAGGVWMSQHILSRVDSISRTAEAISGGDLTQRIPVSGTGDELDRLAETLNRMLDRIGHLLESVRQASNNIAHDLRTPLTRLGQCLEKARAQAHSTADHQHALDAARAEVEALLGTFAALLRIAEVEAGAQRAAFCRVDLSAIVATVAEAFAPSAEEDGRTLAADVAPGVVIHGDRELLTQMLANLVENALRHTPPGTQIKLSLDATAQRAVLVVEDNGPGIPQAEREHVLRRFYRMDQSRTTPGSGLGLSLAAAVAELHGAELRLASAGPGLRVSVLFGGSAVDRPFAALARVQGG
ncbi:MAG TPA: HAMP domain-containing sensor histidine kinase [Acetobacteraceae bacterium]|jgi:signal transduction histidine kinase